VEQHMQTKQNEITFTGAHQDKLKDKIDLVYT